MTHTTQDRQMHCDIELNRIVDMIIVIELNRETSANSHPYFLVPCNIIIGFPRLIFRFVLFFIYSDRIVYYFNIGHNRTLIIVQNFNIVVFVTVHTAGKNEEHADEDKLKLTVFNTDKARQGKAGQTHTQEHRGVTS